jgi:hypothetical protein
VLADNNWSEREREKAGKKDEMFSKEKSKRSLHILFSTVTTKWSHIVEYYASKVIESRLFISKKERLDCRWIGSEDQLDFGEHNIDQVICTTGTRVPEQAAHIRSNGLHSLVEVYYNRGIEDDLSSKKRVELWKGELRTEWWEYFY